MVQVRWTNGALEELAAIRDYALGITPAYAERLIDQLIARTNMLVDFPRIGRMVPEYQDPAIRELVAGKYRIMYEISSAERIDIIHIHPTARPLLP